LKLQVQLYSDLTLSGDGNDEYRFSGGFSEYRSPVNIIKVGKSVVTVAGASHFSGKIELISGTLRIEHLAALGGTRRHSARRLSSFDGVRS